MLTNVCNKKSSVIMHPFNLFQLLFFYIYQMILYWETRKQVNSRKPFKPAQFPWNWEKILNVFATFITFRASSFFYVCGNLLCKPIHKRIILKCRYFRFLLWMYLGIKVYANKCISIIVFKLFERQIYRAHLIKFTIHQLFNIFPLIFLSMALHHWKFHCQYFKAFHVLHKTSVVARS